eukprot:11842877-Prorocentrum_lima.AAC.1
MMWAPCSSKALRRTENLPAVLAFLVSPHSKSTRDLALKLRNLSLKGLCLVLGPFLSAGNQWRCWRFWSRHVQASRSSSQVIGGYCRSVLVSE